VPIITKEGEGGVRDEHACDDWWTVAGRSG
jgi:hypothetical protein